MKPIQLNKEDIVKFCYLLEKYVDLSDSHKSHKNTQIDVYNLAMNVNYFTDEQEKEMAIDTMLDIFRDNWKEDKCKL